MYKCGAVLKGETVKIKKKQDRENRVELDSKDHSKKKFGRDFLKNLQPRSHVQVTERH